MKKPNITEGEWSVLHGLVCSDTKGLVADCEIEELRSMDDGIANAKAISAVPDMIDALIDVLKDWSHDDPYEPYRELSVETIMKIEGALKKAGCE